METLLRKMEVKFDINRFDKYKLKEYLSDSNHYAEFIGNFDLLLNKEVGYEFIYLDKIKTIRNVIRNNKKTRGLTETEKRILKILSLKNFSYEDKLDFKSQYIYSYLYGLGVPASLRGEEFYKKVVNNNYLNIYRFYDILNNSNAFYRENAMSVLASDITTLATVNTILNESNKIDSELYDFLVDISSIKPRKDSFESSRDYHKYRRYQFKTLKQLKNNVYKAKDVNKTDDTDKVLIK